jgi:hypothetical protein
VSMPMEGRIYDNPKRGALERANKDDRIDRSGRPRRTTRGRRESDSVFERETKVMKARLLVDPTPGRRRAGSPSQTRILIKTTKMQGQGGHVRKANDPQPERLLATPRCGISHSGEEVTSLEAPVNSGRPPKPKGRGHPNRCPTL